MVNAIKSLIEVFKTRITNPLLGSIAFFWIIFNWKMIYFFFTSDLEPLVKIKYIEWYYSDPSHIHLYYTVFWAIIIGSLYACLLPYIESAVQFVQLKGIEIGLSFTAQKDGVWEREKLGQQAKTLKVELEALKLREEVLNKKAKIEELEEEQGETESADLEDGNNKNGEYKKLKEENKIYYGGGSPSDDFGEDGDIYIEVEEEPDYFIINPTQKERFIDLYGLENLNGERQVQLMEYAHKKFKLDNSNILNRNAELNNFIGYVKRVDVWSEKEHPNAKLVDLNKIERIRQFHKKQVFPNTDNFWNDFLNLTYPEFTNKKMYEKLDVLGRKFS
ncbi:MAG: hypothetical protein R3D86_12625 [Emcibacteraceae bacterium]